MRAADNLGAYRFSTHRVWPRRSPGCAALASLAQRGADDPTLAYALQVGRNAAGLSGDLASATSAPATPDRGRVRSDGDALRTRLQALAKLLHVQVEGVPLPLRVVTVRAQGGYDTHSGQAPAFAAGVRATADNLLAFWRDLVLRGLDDRVVVLLWTEFGRRPHENGSAGTDHGAAGAAFVIGKSVRQGLVGEFPRARPRHGHRRRGQPAQHGGLPRPVLRPARGVAADGVAGHRPRPGAHGHPAGLAP